MKGLKKREGEDCVCNPFSCDVNKGEGERALRKRVKKRAGEDQREGRRGRRGNGARDRVKNGREEGGCGAFVALGLLGYAETRAAARRRPPGVLPSVCALPPLPPRGAATPLLLFSLTSARLSHTSCSVSDTQRSGVTSCSVSDTQRSGVSGDSPMWIKQSGG